MATSISSSGATSTLDAIGNATAFSVATPYIQLHTASPGSAGTTAIATNSTRKLVSFGAAAAGAIASDADITWTSVAATETYTHWTLWTASSAGTFLGSGTVTGGSVTSGSTFTITSGSLTISFTTAS